MRSDHKWHIQPDTEAKLQPRNHLVGPCSYLMEGAAGQGYECLLLCKIAVCSLFWGIRCRMYNGNQTSSTPALIPLQWKDRLPISLSPVLGLGPGHLLDQHSLVLSLSANVWVYWCAVTGPGWSYPTRIRASCCVSSVCVCPYSHKHSKHRLLKT